MIPRKPLTRANRDTPEAEIEERTNPANSIGKTDEDIRRDLGLARQEPGPKPEATPSDGS